VERALQVLTKRLVEQLAPQGVVVNSEHRSRGDL
jgi:hypothetical protein